MKNTKQCDDTSVAEATGVRLVKATDSTVNVNHFQRRPADAQVSIERLFRQIRQVTECGVKFNVHVCPAFSRGIFGRLKNLWWARQRSGRINHIVGDVHYLAFGLRGQGLVLTIHDCAALSRLTGWRRQLLRYFWFVGPIRRAEVVTTISSAIKAELREWVGELADKIVVVPNCVGSEFQFSDKDFSDRPVILQVGTGWNKNLKRVAEAVQGTPSRLDIVGELRPGQKEVLDRLGVCYRALGRVSDDELVGIYRGADIVVFASLYEGFGLPILEAQATGRPVITSNRGAMVEAAGDGAIFVDPENVSEIRDAICSLINKPCLRHDVVKRGKENVKRFRPEFVAKLYLDIYKEMMSGSS